MQRTIQRLANDIEERKSKISFLDRIAFSSEQDCKRTEQRVQELIAQKDRIEKLIATMLSDDDEDYTKLKAIVKESVQAILSDNKIVISTAFAALVQTLQNDPNMIKAIYNISIANNDKDNKNNSITNYLELNKDRILNLGEKNYENLVEALTNNVINTAAVAASSNPELSLPSSSSSMFLGQSNQDGTYRIEESESFHHSNEDIAD
jgi:hypothetical protein